MNCIFAASHDPCPETGNRVETDTGRIQLHFNRAVIFYSENSEVMERLK
jgi:hypothetical protein